MYYLVHNSAYLNENIEIFLDGIHYTKHQASIGYGVSFDEKNIRSAEESWHLKIGLEKANSLKSLNKIFKYFSENLHDLDDPYFDNCLEYFSKNSIIVCQKRPEIFDSIIDFLIALTGHYNDNTAPILEFFEKAQTKLAVIKKILPKISEKWMVIEHIALLADDEKAFDYIIDQYLTKNIDDRSIWIFQAALKQKNPDAYHRFSSLINLKTDNKFLQVDTPSREENPHKRTSHEAAIEQLFDTDGIIEEVLKIFDTEGPSPRKSKSRSDSAIELRIFILYMQLKFGKVSIKRKKLGRGKSLKID